MQLKDFFTGNFDHEFWKKLCLVLIIEFLGTLMIAWALRPIWIDVRWIYVPFLRFISGLGGGRMDGNPGAWVFMIGFILFAIIGTAWNAYLFRQFRKVSIHYARFLTFLLEISLIAVSFVGIFDGRWPYPDISGGFHAFGANVGFLGNCAVAVLGWVAIAYAYWKTPQEKRLMANPIKLLIAIIWLIIALYIHIDIGGPFWQWTLMFSLMNYVFWISRLFPEDLGQFK